MKKGSEKLKHVNNLSRNFGLIIVFAVVLFGVKNVNATQWTVGVKVGDWAEYSIVWPVNATTTYTGTMKIEVTNVESTTIYYNLSYNPPLPPEYPTTFSSGSIDVSTGVSTGFSLGFFIAANLNAGDQFAPAQTALTINETVSREYSGQNVEVNHLNVSDSSGTTINFYWVKATGMLAEYNIHEVFNGEVSDSTARLTSASVIPEFPTPLLLLTFVAATLSAAIVLRRKKHITKTQKPATTN